MLLDPRLVRCLLRKSTCSCEKATSKFPCLCRWMAPEVISHKQYNGKADVYSFGILLWELLTRKTPYEAMTPIQAAVGVVQDNLRPLIPDGTNRRLRDLMERCWASDPEIRPTFPELLVSQPFLF